MAEQPIPIRRRSLVYSISGSVLFYGMACSLLAAVSLALVMGWLAWVAMHDVDGLYDRMAEYKDSAHAARQATARSRLDLARCEAQMELADRWVLGARKLRTP